MNTNMCGCLLDCMLMGDSSGPDVLTCHFYSSNSETPGTIYASAKRKNIKLKNCPILKPNKGHILHQLSGSSGKPLFSMIHDVPKLVCLQVCVQSVVNESHFIANSSMRIGSVFIP